MGGVSGWGRPVRRSVVATAATAVALFGLARLSATPLTLRARDLARLRLSWSARPERIEVCRALSAEELSRREEHMRQRLECNGRSATYLLRVQVDDVVRDESVVRGAGLRHDRPLYVLREFDVAPGVHHVRVSLTRRERTDNDAAAFTQVESAGADTGIFAGRAEREAMERARRAEAALPQRLVLDSTVSFAAWQVRLVTFEPERRSLRLVGF